MAIALLATRSCKVCVRTAPAAVSPGLGAGRSQVQILLQDLYDWAYDAGLEDAAERFAQGCRARPFLDSGDVPADVRALVMARDDERCQDRGSVVDLTIDHKIIPWIDGSAQPTQPTSRSSAAPATPAKARNRGPSTPPPARPPRARAPAPMSSSRREIGDLGAACHTIAGSPS